MSKLKNIPMPELIFLLFAIIFGAAYAVAVPYGAGFDEEAHIVRIYDISGYRFIPNRNPPSFKNTTTLAEFHDLSFQRRFLVNSAADMFSPASLSLKFNKSGDNYLYGYFTNSFYSPVMFLPQAAVANVFWRRLDFPIFPVVMLMRIAGLLMYIVGSFLAIRVLPFGKWTLTVLALSPMALFQAATLNVDGFSIAVSFLFVALVLALWANPPYKTSSVLALFVTMLLLGSGKPGAIVLLPLILMLSPWKFSAKKGLFLVLAGALLAVVLNLGWTWLALSGTNVVGNESGGLVSKVARVQTDVPAFVMATIYGITTYALKFARNWMASYGYWIGTVPDPVFWFYPLLLLASLFTGPVKNTAWRGRLWLLGMFLLTASATLGIYFVGHYSDGNIGNLRQGRYLIPYTPLLFIGLSGLFPIAEKLKKFIIPAVVGMLALVLGFYSFGLYATYFTDCGYPAFVGRGCILPQYKNLDTNSIAEIKVNTETPVSQSFGLNCTGLKEIQVDVSSLPDDQSAALKMTLLDSQGTTLASAQYPVAQIVVNQYLSMPLPGITSTKGDQYTILLESAGLQASSGFGLALRGREAYDGVLQAAGKPVKDDLLFHYVCVGP